MIIKLDELNEHSINVVASMLYAMYMELKPEDCSTDPSDYLKVAEDYLLAYDVIIETEGKGLFIMRNEDDPLTPKLVQWFGLVVYIKPQYRKGKLLKDFYDYLFANYEGNILGLTEINSEHIKVLDKRHTCIGKLYRLTRS